MIHTIAQIVGEKQAENIIEAGLKDPTTRSLLVISLISIVAFIIHIKWFRPSKIEELGIKNNIEQARATQTVNIANTAATQERSVVAAVRVLELSEKHLNILASDELRCKGGK